MKLTHFDLFSGIGGFALAANRAGFQTVGFSEIDEFCCKVLTKNFPTIQNYGDITKLQTIPKVNLLTGGFPCQPFSQAGQKKGKNDVRYLWPEFKRIIANGKPDYLIIENVGASISMVLDDILIDLENSNYQAIPFVLPACASNAPHRRDRLWIIAHSNSLGDDEWFSDWNRRYLQKNQNRHLEKIQQEWTQFQPDTWQTYKARDWLQYNTNSCRRNNGLPSRLDKDRIKSLGNAIVPQTIYPIIAKIAELLTI